MNAKNVSEQSGNLVLEIICANTVTQADAVSACTNYQNTVTVPPAGARIVAVGPYVLDSVHGWNEIHPVWSITVVSARVTSSPSPGATFAIAVTTASPTFRVVSPSPVPTVTTSTAPTLPVTSPEPTQPLAPVSTTQPTQAPTSAPTSPPTTAPATAPPTAANLCGASPNPWGYNFCAGSLIYSPPSNFCSYFSCIASFWNGVGYVIQCNDLTFSKSGGRSGSCSQHGGNYRALYAP